MMDETNMANKSRINQAPPAAVEDAIRRLGRDIRTARLRRKLRIEDVANRIGASRFTVADVEKGKSGRINGRLRGRAVGARPVGGDERGGRSRQG